MDSEGLVGCVFAEVYGFRDYEGSFSGNCSLRVGMIGFVRSFQRVATPERECRKKFCDVKSLYRI